MMKSYHINDPRLEELRSAYFLNTAVSLDGHEGRFDVIGIEPNGLFTDRIDVTFRKHIDELKKVKDVYEGGLWVTKVDVPRFESGMLTYKREDCMPKQDDRAVTPTVVVDLFKEVDVLLIQYDSPKGCIKVVVRRNERCIQFFNKYNNKKELIYVFKEKGRDVFAKLKEIPYEADNAWIFQIIERPDVVFTIPIMAGPRSGPFTFTQLHRARMNKVKKI